MITTILIIVAIAYIILVAMLSGYELHPFWLGFRLGRFSIGLCRWPFNIFMFDTDSYGNKGIEIYVNYLFQFWITWDTNHYDNEVEI